MADIYQPDVLVGDNKIIIPLRFVESIQIVRDIDDSTAVVNVLKGDILIEITTLSGNRHQVSMLDLYNRIGNFGMPSDPSQLYNAICDKWIRSIK